VHFTQPPAHRPHTLRAAAENDPVLAHILDEAEKKTPHLTDYTSDPHIALMEELSAVRDMLAVAQAQAGHPGALKEIGHLLAARGIYDRAFFQAVPAAGGMVTIIEVRAHHLTAVC